MDRMESHLLRILKCLDNRCVDITKQVVPNLPAPPKKSCLKPSTTFLVLPKVHALPVVATKVRATETWTIITIPNDIDNLRIGDVLAQNGIVDSGAGNVIIGKSLTKALDITP